MFQFRRAIRIFLLVLSLLLAAIAAAAGYFLRMLVNPPRKRLWATPTDLGMKFEEVQFPARDGLRLSGWFIAAKADEPAPTLVLVHGWPWNRLGTAAENLWNDMPGTEPIQLIRLALSLHKLGYHLLMFDLRNHGLSASGMPFSFGLQEANDLLGAVDYVAARSDVDAGRIGVIGFSAGANSVLFALPQTERIAAAVAVQPTSPRLFTSHYVRHVAGPLAKAILPVLEAGYRLAGGLRLAAIEPTFAAAGAGPTPVLFLQGTGDPWGSVDNVNEMAQTTPNAAQTMIIETGNRFEGYRYAIDHPDLLDEFFRHHLTG